MRAMLPVVATSDLSRMHLTKAAVVAHLHQLIEDRLATSSEAIISTRASFTSDTKSSAGDKHEVGRAMVQQELDKLEAQHAQLLVLQRELQRVPMERSLAQVAFGSLVTTDQGVYFIAIGLGPVLVDGYTCYAVSLASPIGQVLQGKATGDAVSFNSRRIVVQGVE